MLKVSCSAFRFLGVLAAPVAVLLLGITSAHAQSASCSRLEQTLATLERNGDFRNVGTVSREVRTLGQQLQRMESQYVRGGCNDDAKAGRQLSRECRTLARDITQGRENVQRLTRSIETGNAVAEQREAVLQEIARFGCGSRSRVIQDNRRDRGNIFDQLFGGFTRDDSSNDTGNDYIEEAWDPWGNYHTVRTLCVRKSDGFYWPISYSTLTDYVANDADQCRQMCPGLDVDLYYHDNPGQEPEQMINMYGEPYTALPNAFKFRTEIDKSATCKPPTNYGSIQIADLGDGQSRAIIEFQGATFPLPMRDPRRQSRIAEAVVQQAHFVEIPLPRRRPAAPGEEPKAVPVAPSAAQPMRVVQFGEKRVRIVGPDTPYAPTAAAGT